MCKSLRKVTISLFRGIAQIMLFKYFQVFRSDPDVSGFNRIVFTLTIGNIQLCKLILRKYSSLSLPPPPPPSHSTEAIWRKTLVFLNVDHPRLRAPNYQLLQKSLHEHYTKECTFKVQRDRNHQKCSFSETESRKRNQGQYDLLLNQTNFLQYAINQTV